MFEKWAMAKLGGGFRCALFISIIYLRRTKWMLSKCYELKINESD